MGVLCVTLISFGLYSIISRRNLREAYNHKQRVMEMHAAFEEKVDGTDMSDQLTQIVLNTIKDNPQKHVKNPSITEELKNIVNTIKSDNSKSV